MVKKLTFSKKLPFFCFSAVFLCPKRKNFVYYISETTSALRLYKTLTIIYKTKAFSQKNEMNIAKKSHFKQNFGIFSSFFFIFKVFLLFCSLILKILRQTSFLIKKTLFLSVSLKNRITQICFTWNLGSLCHLIFLLLFHVKHSRTQALHENDVSRETK